MSGTVEPHPLPRDAGWHARLRVRRCREAAGGAYPLRVAQVADPDHLVDCYRTLRRDGGQAPGVDGVRYDAVSMAEAADALRELSSRVLAGNYRPRPTTPASIPKTASHPGVVAFRTLQLGTVWDRVVGRAVAVSLERFWEDRSHQSSYGFRPGRGPHQMLADLVAAMEATGRSVVATDDIMTAFDTVPVGELVRLHEVAFDGLDQPGFDAAEKAKTLALVEAVLRGHDAGRTTGIDQGSPYSPMALNVLLTPHVDAVGNETQRELPRYRYCDNLACLCRSKSEAGDVLSAAAGCLNPLGMTLKGQDPAADLAKGERAELLGFSLRRARGGSVDIGLGSGATSRLADAVAEAIGGEHPHVGTLQVLAGWVGAYGPADGSVVVEVAVNVARGHGCREVPVELLRGRWRAARGRWLDLLRRARRRAAAA